MQYLAMYNWEVYFAQVYEISKHKYKWSILLM